MPFACIHTHTCFCDGADDVESCCQAAYKKGLVSLGFSAHAPVTRKMGIRTAWHLPDEKLNEYTDTVRAAQKRWEGKLPIYLGLEVEFISGIMGPADSDYRTMGLDFIIASVHYVIPPKGEPFTVDDSMENVDKGIRECYGGDPTGMVEAYWDAEEAMIRAGSFDLLGHPDLIRKNNTGQCLFPEDDKYYRRANSIAVLMAETQVRAELNTGGMNRGKTKDCYPSSRFLTFFHEQGVPMVINADAHRAEDLDGHYEVARQTLLAAGYTETLIFEGRRDGRALWGSIKL